MVPGEHESQTDYYTYNLKEIKRQCHILDFVQSQWLNLLGLVQTNPAVFDRSLLVDWAVMKAADCTLCRLNNCTETTWRAERRSVWFWEQGSPTTLYADSW